jgi:hypothetical protein
MCNLVSDIKGGLRMFENRVLRRIFGPNIRTVKRYCRTIQNEVFENLYSSPDIKMIKWQRLRWAERASRMRGEEECI